MHGVVAAHGLAEYDMVENGPCSQHQRSYQETEKQAVGACRGGRLGTEEALIPHHEAVGRAGGGEREAGPSSLDLNWCTLSISVFFVWI